MIHGHGSDAYLYADELKLDLSTNVWFGGAPSGLMQHLSQKLYCLESYPEPDSASLAESMLSHFRLAKGSCFIDNGTTAIFYKLARLFRASKSQILIPAFSEYEDAARAEKHHLIFTHLNELTEDQKFKAPLVWLGRPNNPDGHSFGVSIILSWLESNPDVLFIIDESYIDLCFNIESLMPLLFDYKNLLIIKSFTKNFTIPGLRLGALFADPKIIEQLRRFKVPWEVNSLAQEAGKYILNNYQDCLPDPQCIQRQNLQLTQLLKTVSGIEIQESSTNYILIKLKHAHASDCKQFLLKEYGILIRDASNFRGLTAHHIRISINSSEQQVLVVEALKNYIEKFDKDSIDPV